MPKDDYYYKICKKCRGFKNCEPRNEKNIEDCMQRNKSNEPPLKNKELLEEICECGHTKTQHTWILQSTGEKHKFRSDCGICKCKKFKLWKVK